MIWSGSDEVERLSKIIVRNGDINQALKALKRKWDVSLKEIILDRKDGYKTRGQRRRRKCMRGKARWRQKEKLIRERG